MALKAFLLATAMILAGPALAAAQTPVRTADATATAAGSGNSTASKPAQPDLKKYCVEVEPPTGSLLKMTECKTREQWAKEGVDVDQLTKN